MITEEECREMQPVFREFAACYVKNQDRPVEEWLGQKLSEELTDRSADEIREMTDDIVAVIRTDEEKQASLSRAIASGRSRESWFASEAKRATSAMSAQEASKYLSGLDEALSEANEQLHQTIMTRAGSVSLNPRLDGFIAEQYHVQTFNMNAKATGSQYRAKLVRTQGKGFGKNSVDIVIVDKNGNVVRRYQSKYGKDAASTRRAFEHGNYRGQCKLVPDGQEDGVKKKATNVIAAPDGTSSNPLTKTRAEQMRDEAQSGNWNDLNWNEYAMRDLAMGIGKQAGYAALQGAAIGVGFDLAQKVWNGEQIEAGEVVEKALKSGADFGVKAAAAGALKVGAEKGILTMIPKGTPAGTLANIAHVAVENVKIVGKMMDGTYTFREGLEQIEQTTVSTTAGLLAMGKGAQIGAAAGAVFGPPGAVIGGFVGGTVGYLAGSKVGEAVVAGARRIRDGAQKVAETLLSGAQKAVSVIGTVAESVGNFYRGLFHFFSA